MSTNSYDKDFQQKYEKYAKIIEAQFEEKFQAKLLEEQKKIIDAVIKFKPELEKDKKNIYDKILQQNDKKTDNNDNKNKPIVLDEFTYEGTKYYKDKMGCVWNYKADPVGTIGQYNGTIECILFKDNEFNDDDSSLPTLND